MKGNFKEMTKTEHVINETSDSVEQWYQKKLREEKNPSQTYEGKKYVRRPRQNQSDKQQIKKNSPSIVFYRIVNTKTKLASTGGLKPLFVKVNGKFYLYKQLMQYLKTPGIIEMYKNMPEWPYLKIRKYVVTQQTNLPDPEEFVEKTVKDKN